jgi:hypothetical protein
MGSGLKTSGGPGNTLLVWLARVLPKEFVRRVAEPALLDEAHRWSVAGQVPMLARTRFVCSCLWVGAPLVFWDRRRPTGVAMVLLGSALVLMVALLLWAPYLYPTQPIP